MPEQSKVFTELISSLIEKLYGWMEKVVLLLPNLVVAVVVVVIFLLFSRLVEKITSRILARVSSNQQINNLLSSLVRIGIVLAGLFTALGILQLDKTVTSLLAGVGILGLALGFAFQDLAANFMSGIIMSIIRPFKIGDVIRTNDFLGVIQAISLRSTSLKTFDGQSVLLPNKDVFGNPLINYSEDPKRRVDLRVGVSYGDNLELAREVAIEAVEAIPERIKEREVELFYSEFADSSITFEIRFWVPYHKQADYLAARSEAITRIKKAFDENRITIPFPIRTVDFGSVGGTRLAEELDRQQGNGRPAQGVT